MKIDIITLFPNMFTGPFDQSMINKAKDKKLVKINVHNLRKWTDDKHQTADDRPYGGGKGMILMVKPIYKAVKELKTNKTTTILLTPQGQLFNQEVAAKLAKQKHLILICGHYEGFDNRIKNFIDQEISIGDYVLTGGEIPAMVLTDAITRLIPRVLSQEAKTNESFKKIKINNKKVKLLDFPQYTRPENFKGLKVPKILLSGNHQKIK